MAEHRGGSGNFAENREKASEAGRKGGQNSGGNFKMIRNAPLKQVKRRSTKPWRRPQIG